MSEAFEMLQELLGQDQFELLIPEEGKNIRLVYLMNDAVESFLVFRNAHLTGIYRQDYEGELEFSLSRDEQKAKYILSVWQGDSVVTILFQNLEQEVYLYNYGETAHFWVSGYEYLRQLEYRIAIMRDKLDYLGERFCNAGEQKLAMLRDFPPLNYCCYPAVPKKYIVPMEDPWSPSAEALEVMEELAIRADDRDFLRMLIFYRNCPFRFVSRWIGRQLRRKKHARLVDELTDQIRQETSQYPNRSFGKETDAQMQSLLRRAYRRKDQIQSGKKLTRVEVLREEPFTTAQDDLGMQVWVMSYKNGFWNRKVTVEKISVKKE